MSAQKTPPRDEAETSKFLSYILRHKPESIGLRLDAEGWASVDELLRRAAENGRTIPREHLFAVVANNGKKRFALSGDGLRIRAVQGHSTPQVDISFTPATPPETLFHGTARRFLPSILAQGLLPGERQYVHLSADAATAHAVGSRHGAPVVLRINAAAMARQGALFFLSENGVWLTRQVPPACLEEMPA